MISFASINTAKPVWWFDIPLAKVQQSLYLYLHLLCFDDVSNILYHLEIPTAYLRDQESGLAVRTDKACISLELSTLQANRFRDRRPTGRGVEFRQFLKHSFEGES